MRVQLVLASLDLRIMLLYHVTVLYRKILNCVNTSEIATERSRTSVSINQPRIFRLVQVTKSLEDPLEVRE